MQSAILLQQFSIHPSMYVCLSVCLSVCHMRWYCANMTETIIKQSTLYGSVRDQVMFKLKIFSHAKDLRDVSMESPASQRQMQVG